MSKPRHIAVLWIAIATILPLLFCPLAPAAVIADVFLTQRHARETAHEPHQVAAPDSPSTLQQQPRNSDWKDPHFSKVGADWSDLPVLAGRNAPCVLPELPPPTLHPRFLEVHDSPSARGLSPPPQPRGPPSVLRS